MSQIIVPFRVDSSAPTRIRSGQMPWQRSRMSIALFNSGFIGGICYFWYNRPDMSVAEATKVIAGGGVSETTLGEFDVDYMASPNSRDWFDIPEAGNGALTAYQNTGVSMWGMLIFEEQINECHHCKARHH